LNQKMCSKGLKKPKNEWLLLLNSCQCRHAMDKATCVKLFNRGNTSKR
jgi:hypothetical protein